MERDRSDIFFPPVFTGIYFPWSISLMMAKYWPKHLGNNVNKRRKNLRILASSYLPASKNATAAVRISV